MVKTVTQANHTAAVNIFSTTGKWSHSCQLDHLPNSKCVAQNRALFHFQRSCSQRFLKLHRPDLLLEKQWLWQQFMYQ